VQKYKPHITTIFATKFTKHLYPSAESDHDIPFKLKITSTLYISYYAIINSAH